MTDFDYDATALALEPWPARSGSKPEAYIVKLATLEETLEGGAAQQTHSAQLSHLVHSSQPQHNSRGSQVKSPLGSSSPNSSRATLNGIASLGGVTSPSGPNSGVGLATALVPANADPSSASSAAICLPQAPFASALSAERQPTAAQ